MRPVSPRATGLPLIVATAISVGALLAMMLLPARAQTQVQDLPPRGTLTPTPTPTPNGKPTSKPAPAGALIELHAQFPPIWPWNQVHWQELWTGVQWQDAWGDWHDVEGWQGTLDTVALVTLVAQEEAKEVTIEGRKTWWVAEADLGKGPFRWQIYRNEDGQPLATSAPFNLPGSTNVTAQVDVSLEAP